MQERFETFTVLIAGINRSIRRIKMDAMTVFALKSQHVTCLHYLYKDGPQTASELCETCEEDKANISRSLDFLEENGYIKKRPPHRRYRVPLELTDKGRTVGKFIADRIREVLVLASEGVCEENRTVMYESLSVIYQNLQRISDGPSVVSEP